MHFHTELNTA